MNIKNYMTKTKVERQRHVNLSLSCIQPYKRWCTGRKYAVSDLLKIVAVDSFSFSNENIHVAHLCKNDSHSGNPCINPYHLYLSTPSENYCDIDKLKRKSRSSAGGKATWDLTKDNHNFDKQKTCQHCNKEFNVRGIYRHEKSCEEKNK
jgi:hypothetical protein